MIITKLIIGAITITSIIVIASSAREAKKAKDKCDAYLKEVRERSKL